jgi:hypothetical protein
MRWTIAMVLLLSVGGVARADFVSIGAAKDNTLYETAGGELSNGQGDGFFAGKISLGVIRRGVISFDIASAVPAGSTITNVNLVLTVVNAPPGAGNSTVSLNRLLADWGEGASNTNPGPGGSGAQAAPGDATWIHRFFNGTFWTTPGGDFAATVSGSQSVGAAGPFAFSSAGMLADVQAWLANPATNYGWIVRGDESMIATARKFASGEALDPETRPRLEITFIPAPGSAGILGLAGVVAARRRRR